MIEETNPDGIHINWERVMRDMARKGVRVNHLPKEGSITVDQWNVIAIVMTEHIKVAEEQAVRADREKRT